MQRRFRPDRGTRRAVWIACGVVLWMLSLRAAAYGPPQHDWAPPVHTALEAYFDGRYPDAQRMCQGVLRASRDERVRRDAALLQALCLLRMPARTDCLDGRGRLAQLAHEDPSLENDPECNLAYGLAQATLAETASALDAVDRAATEFVEHSRQDRAREALLALAKIWMQHTEWEATPTRFAIERPLGHEAIHAVRRERVAQVRKRLATLPNSAAPLAEVDLAWAQHCLKKETTAEQGRKLLEKLATPASITPAGYEAALLLAEMHEEAGRVSKALELYDRLRSDASGDVQHRARERSEALRKPSLELMLPGTARVGQSVPFALGVRGIPAVQMEVRQVDLAAWLAKPATRGNEALLPESGSLRAAWDFETVASDPAGWWTSDVLDPQPTLQVPVGAYVVVVRGHDVHARQHTLKRLFLVSDLAAVSVLGSDHAVVWASSAGTLPGTLEGQLGQFWMQRSFAPTRLTFNDGIARFRLPGEARVMRDKDWYCLVRTGAHLALCRGRLPTEAGEAAENRDVIMIGGPQTPPTGAALYVSGRVSTPHAVGTAVEHNVPIELQVFDALDQRMFVHSVQPDAGGVFSTEIPIGPDLAGKNLRIIPRRGGQVLENLAKRLTLSVPAAETRRLHVRCEIPDWFTEPTPLVSGTVSVEYPWGTAPVGLRTRVLINALQLPVTASNNAPQIGTPVVRDGRIDARGQYSFVFSVSPAEFRLTSSPVAIRALAHVHSHVGWEGRANAEVLLAHERPHTWLAHQPDEAHVGDAVCFNVGWLEPGGLAVADLTDIEVRRNDAPVARLKLEPTWDGLVSETWQPAEPGSYHVTTTIPVVDGKPIQLQKTVVVLHADPEDAEPVPAGLRCRAHFTRRDGRTGVQVVMEGRTEGPVAVVVESGDPVAAMVLDDAAEDRTVFLPLAGEKNSTMRILVIGSAVHEPRVLATASVAPDPDLALRIRLDVSAVDVWPGTRVPLTCATENGQKPPSGTTILFRLIDAIETGLTTQPEEESRAATPTQGVSLVSSDRAPGTSGDCAMARSEPAYVDISSLDAVLGEGETLWSQWRTFDTPQCDITVPIPTRPGLYRLLATTITPDGALDTHAVILDGRRGVRVWLDTPQRVTLGDRTLLAVRVENGAIEPQTVQLRLNPGNGLDVESLRRRGSDGAVQAVDAGPLTLDLSGSERVWVLAEVEAARPGASQAEVEVTGVGSRRAAQQNYEILPSAEGAESDGTLRVTRTVTVWSQIQSEEATPNASAEGMDETGDSALMRGGAFKDWLDEQRDPKRRRWSESPWSPTDRLAPGQYIKVREEFTLTRWQAGGLWAQRVPATCYRVLHGRSDLQTIGVPTPSRGDEMHFRVEPLGPGAYGHEYFMVVARPGSCVLPPPILEVAGKRVPLVVDPGEIQLIVVGRD